MLGSYNGSLAYGDLAEELRVMERYGKEYTGVTAKSFRRWTLKPTTVALDNKKQRHSMWVMSAPFCVVSYINDPRYLPGGEKSRVSRRLILREASVVSKCAAPRARTNYKKQEVLHLAILENIKIREELLVGR